MEDVASVALGIVYLSKALESVKSTPYARCKLGRFQVALDSSNPLEHVLWKGGVGVIRLFFRDREDSKNPERNFMYSWQTRSTRVHIARCFKTIVEKSMDAVFGRWPSQNLEAQTFLAEVGRKQVPIDSLAGQVERWRRIMDL